VTILDAWERFLRSLETDGGRLMVLLSMLLFMLTLTAWMLATGHTPAETGRILLASAISSILGILYGYLGKKSS
jgi:hypothetical protein